MELRKDPITRSWVITGDEPGDASAPPDGPCRFCADSHTPAHIIASSPDAPGTPWSARSVVHPRPLYHIEGDPGRRGDGLYDRMYSVGAHEVLVENPRHDRHLWNASDDEIGHFLRLAAERILDLKRDARIKYVSLFKDTAITPARNSATLPRRSLRPCLSLAAYSTNSAPDANTSSPKSAASSATSFTRRNGRRSALSKLAATISRPVPTPRGSRMKPGLCRATTRLRLNARASTSRDSG